MVVRVDMKGVHCVKSRGKTYYYAWRGGPRLEGEPGSQEFLRSFTEAKDPLRSTDKTQFRGWITLYKASSDFTNLAPLTKKKWAPWLDRIADHFGKLPMRQFDRPGIRLDIRQWRDKWKDQPRTADYAKQVLSRVLSYAVENGALSVNPCTAIQNLYDVDRSEIVWLQDDIEHFCKANAEEPNGREMAWAVKLAALTGLRQADLFRATWGNVGAHAIELRTGKSRGRKRAIALLTAEIRTLLDAIKAARPGKDATTILTNSRGLPWKGFGSSWAKALDNAWPDGKDLHFHDLRGTAATNYYRAGFTTREIAQMFGWSEEQVEKLIERYVKRDEILLDRVRRLEKVEPLRANGGGTDPVKRL